MKLAKSALLVLLLERSVAVAEVAQPTAQSKEQPTCKDEVSCNEPKAEVMEVRERFKNREVVENDWGKPQVVDEGDILEATWEVINATEEYMREVVYKEEFFKPFRNACINTKAHCSQWAAAGDCNLEDMEEEEDRIWMIENCSPTCHTCELLMGEPVPPMLEQEQEQRHPEPTVAAQVQRRQEQKQTEEEEKDGEYPEEEALEDSSDDWDSEDDFDEEQDYSFLEWDLEEEYAGEFVKKPWGVQNLGIEEPEEIRKYIEVTHKYMIEHVYQEKIFDHVIDICEDKYPDCAIWANDGACTSDAAPFMKFNCPASCRSCEMLEYEHRCPMNEDYDWVLKKPGDLNAIFERITTDPRWTEEHGPLEILSSPATDGPWLITIDNFVSDAECDRFIEIGNGLGYDRSRDFGELDVDGTVISVESTGRTSLNAWCPEECNTDHITGPVHRRMEELVGSHYNNSETLQLLSYTAGQFYETHHDYLVVDYDRPYGPRIITVYLYLADVEQGGGTSFPELDMVVMPKRGRVVMWPSVLDEAPWEKDERTVHAALPVEKGRKYGANAWVHLGDFKTAMNTFCT